MGIGDVDEQIVLIVELLIGDPWAPAPEPTPIYDEVLADHEAAKAAGLEWHPHWRMEADLRADAYAEAEAAFYDDGPWY